MKIVVAGLGRLGKQIARKLSQDGHAVIAHNRSPGPIDEAITYGATAAYSKADALKALGSDRLVVWLMLPAEVTDGEIDAWLDVAPSGSILVNGGNSHFSETVERAKRIAERGSTLLDVGVSGGIWGCKNGFSMMVGGDQSAYGVLEPALASLAKPEGGYHYFGPSGAGHYVKMVHNAIEYGMMESLAEGYRMLKEGPYGKLDLAAAGNVWQHRSVVTSWLNQLSRDALQENPELSGISGYVAETGETRWTLDLAKERGIPLPAIRAAFDVRLASQKGETSFATKLVAAMRNRFGGHSLNKEP